MATNKLQKIITRGIINKQIPVRCFASNDDTPRSNLFGGANAKKFGIRDENEEATTLNQARYNVY